MLTVLNSVARPRAVQAFIVVLFSLLVAYLAARGEPIPDIIGFSLSAIIGYYFGDSQTRKGEAEHA